jgi:ribosomal protein S18 acetylase RimI-like enzyme
LIPSDVHPPSLIFCPVQTDQDIQHLASIASEIWHAYWPDIIGADQTDYMVSSFQSVTALTHDICHGGFNYWIVKDQAGTVVGYTAAAVEMMNDDAQHNVQIHHSDVIDAQWPHRLFISKIYLYASERGKHYASSILARYQHMCSSQNIPAMYLTVNRNNHLGVRAYKGNGFCIAEQVDTPIGDDFVMNDFIMVKSFERG